MSGTSGFIYGKFRNFVDKQIAKRNELFSKRERSPEEVLYLNGKTSWVKMTSAVNFTSSSFLGKSYNLYGDGIAKQYQLHGGTLFNNVNAQGQDESVLREGFKISSDKGITTNKNYGLGGYQEAGFRPMPGIESVSVVSKNQFGSLREATVNFKCYTIAQLNVLESLYMRPGYQILLEWGHTLYYDNNYKFTSGKNIPYIDFFSPNKSINFILAEIEVLKKDSGGNYDAILGIVKNFSFTANADGSYDCTTNIITWGEIVESLKISTAPVVQIASNAADNYTANLDPLPAISYGKTYLEEYFTKLKQSWNAPPIPSGSSKAAAAQFVKEIDSLLGSSYYQIEPDNDTGTFGQTESTSKYIDNTFALGFKYETTTLGGAAPFATERDVFVQLGHVFNVLNTVNGLYSQGTKLLPINIGFNTNRALTNPLQFSTNPKICYYPGDPNYYLNGARYISGTYENSVKNANPRNASNSQIMNFMGLAINIDYILTTVSECRDQKTGEVSLLNFLQRLMGGINSALGYYNNFDVKVENNTIRIVDDQHLPLDYGLPSQIILTNANNPSTNTNNLSGKIFGFCQAYNFQSRITNKLGTVLAVSAQANAQALNLDSVSFSTLNKGMKDRYNRQLLDFAQKSKGVAEDDEKDLASNKGFFLLNKFHELITDVVPALRDSDIANAQSFLKDLLKKVKNALGAGNSGTAFIPIDLNLTVDGISGIRIGECFTIEPEKLPANYKWDNGKPKVKFLVRKIDHSITNNRWVTNISALSVINPKVGSGFVPAGGVASVINTIVSTAYVKQQNAALLDAQAREAWRQENAARLAEIDANKARRDADVAILDGQINIVKSKPFYPTQQADIDRLQKQRDELANPNVTVTNPTTGQQTVVGFKDDPVYQATQSKEVINATRLRMGLPPIP